MKNIFAIIVLLLSGMFLGLNSATAATQSKPLVINKAFLQKLASLKTSREIEALLGKPCCCVPAGKSSDEVAICQWKADINNNSTVNTLNITYEVDHVVQVRAITEYYTYVIKNGKVLLEN